MLELYDTYEILEGKIPLSFKLIDSYQREYHLLTEKINCTKYQKGSFRGGRNTIEIVT